MSSKVNNVDFIRSLMRRSGKNRDEIALFMSELQNVIEDGLQNDKHIKIAGLGVFKLQWNEPRMSVNVRTGKPIEIEGHYKLVFVPEPALRNLVNQPLEHLETVELSDEKPNSGAEQQDDSQFELPLRKLTEQALELKDVLNDIQNTDFSVGNKKEEQNDEITKTSEKEKIEKLVVSSSNKIGDKIMESQESKVLREEPSRPEDVSKDNDIVAETKKNDAAISASDMLENSLKNGRNKKHRSICIGILVVAIVSIVSAVILLFKPFDIKTTDEAAPIEDNTIAAVESVDSVDYVVDDRTPVTVAQVNSSSGIAAFDKERRYIQFSDTVELTAGSRLTWVAFQKFGNKVFWPYIYEANMDHLSNPNKISVGTKLRIPILPEELLDEKNTEAVKYAKELHDYYVK